MRFVKKIHIAIIIFTIIFLFAGCGDKLTEIDKFEKVYPLVNQNGEEVVFPLLTKGKIAVVGYIFTNCPDICPLTTNNMRLIQERLKKEEIENVEFVSISFDPQTDTPEVLRKFAEIRNYNLSNWSFLTGQKSIIDSLIKKAGVFAVIGDSTVFKDGRKIYYYVHTDRIQLIDAEGTIRKNYFGSKINFDEIISDIKYLAGE